MRNRKGYETKIAGDETKTREEGDDNEEVDDLGSQLNFSSSTHENEMPVKMEGGISDQFGIVRSFNMATNGMQDSSEFSTTANFCQQGRSQSGRVSFMSIRERINPDNCFANPEGSPNADPEGSEFYERNRRDPAYTKTRHLLEIKCIKLNIHCTFIT